MERYPQIVNWYFVTGMAILASGIIVSGVAFWYYIAIFAPMQQNIRRQALNQKIINAIEQKYCTGTTYANEKVKKYCEYSKIVSAPKFPTPTSTNSR